MYDFHVCKWKNAYIKDLNTLRILMNFLCIYLGEGKGGGALMHVYVWQRIVGLHYRTTWWMFTKLGRDEELMAPVYALRCFIHICPGADPGRGKNRSREMGGPLLLKYSSLDQKATATILYDFHVCKLKNAYIKDLNALRILMNFYVFI